MEERRLDNMNQLLKEHFFPTIIYAKDLQLDNEALAQHIIKWSKSDNSLVKTNVNGWHSPTDMNTKSEYNSLINELFKMQQEIYNEEFLEGEPQLGNMWANINYSGGYNKPHVHPNCLFSGVYYVKTQPNCGNLVVNDPRPGVQLRMPKTKIPIDSSKMFDMPKELWREARLQPVQGRLIMFPAWLWHCVEENKTNDIRISVSFNFIQGGGND